MTLLNVTHDSALILDRLWLKCDFCRVTVPYSRPRISWNDSLDARIMKSLFKLITLNQQTWYTECIKMIGAVLKLITFTSMVNRIISASRNERVIQQFYDTYLQTWPARSPDLTPCDYFLWDYVKDKVFVPPQPVSIPDLKNRITVAVETITPDLLSRVWQELD